MVASGIEENGTEQYAGAPFCRPGFPADTAQHQAEHLPVEDGFPGSLWRPPRLRPGR